MADYDLAIVGGGPSGSACATFAARAGLKVLLLEKERFPREKVCGDCINPSCWPVFERLGIADQITGQPHAELREVELMGVTGASRRFTLRPGPRGEIAIRRSLLDQILLQNARTAGVEVREQEALQALRHDQEGFRLDCSNGSWTARLLVGADGRNSTVARLGGIAPLIQRERVAMQTHLPCPAHLRQRVVMRLCKEGYCGLADVGDGILNVCLVSKPADMPSLKTWAQGEFGVPEGHPWRTITPLARLPSPVMHGNLLLVGDAARVVEPFTGEGIYYAIATGELAARCVIEKDLASYPRLHRALYKGRVWVNQLAKAAVLHPRVASKLLQIAPQNWIRLLTAKVVGPAMG